MAKKKSPSVQTVAVRNNNTGKTKMAQQPQGAAGLGSNIAYQPKQAMKSPASSKIPSYDVTGRMSPYVAMCLDPINADPALPPVALNFRAVPLKQYQEILLSTDANGNAAVYVSPRMNSQYVTATTFSGTSITAVSAAANNAEYASFSTNFYQYIPLCMEVVVKYTGSMTAVAGRMYGIVSPNFGAATVNLVNFPLDPNGCEAVTSDGVSCTWYSTLPVWANPILATSTTNSSESGDVQVIVGLIGGPASVTNLLTVGVYLHLAAYPNPSICGLTPRFTMPDDSAVKVASLLSMANSGVGASSTSLVQRDKKRGKYKGQIRDVLRVGGKIIGLVSPHLGSAASVAEALSMLLV